MTLPVADPSTLVDASSLAALQREAATHNPKALRQAAQQFESLFVGMVLKSMRQANFSDPLFGSDQESMYQDMYDDQIAAEISKGGGVGLADRLVQQLRRSGLAGTTQGGSTASSTVAPTSSSAQDLGGAVSTRLAIATSRVTSSSPAGSSAGSAGTPATSSVSAASAGTSSCPSSAQQLEFARSLWPDAQQAAQQLGVSPVSLVAQAALETDWGRSLPRTANGSSSHNLFGIKAGAGWSGARAQSDTQEYESGTATTVKAQFRAYGTPSQCFQDYVSLLVSSPRYAAALGTGGDTQAFATALQQGGYATDPNYAAKLGAMATTLTRALSHSGGAASGGTLGATALKSASSLPTTSGSNTL